MTIIHALILGVVEGITEFLPISSTAHLLFAERLMHIQETPFLATFDIVIQLGAIAAVAVAVVRRVLADLRLVLVGIVGFIPTAILGAVAYPYVKELLMSSPLIPILALGIGGVILILFEKGRGQRGGTEIEKVEYKQGFWMGLAQSLAFIPGVSRSAASVVGGMLAGMDRRAAVELSFIMAIPTMLAASGLDLVKTGWTFTSSEWHLLIAGLVASFVTGFIAVQWLLKYIKTHTFTGFGVYRIVAAVVLAIVLLR